MTAVTKCGFEFERQVWCRGIRPVAGLDESGRGPLAGPVTAAAVILPENFTHPFLTDSKQLSAKKRGELYAELTDNPAVTWSVAVIAPGVVDRMNILRASHEAMRQALASLALTPSHALIDGLPVKPFPIPQTAIVKGDGKSFSIAAASVIAKVTRDRIMQDAHEVYPQYEFHEHKGYATPRHRELLRKYGPCPIHRRSFLPVAELFLPL